MNIIQVFKYDDVINYNHSFNTNQKFIHYEFEFPNNSIQPLISGNYVLRLFDELDSTVLLQKIYGFRNSTFIKSNIKKATLEQIETLNMKLTLHYIIQILLFQILFLKLKSY